MSKKKKKNKYFSELTGKKSGKKNKKDLKKAMAKKAKVVKPTLTKKDAKLMKKIITKPVKVDKDFIKLRAKCNHGDGVITTDEFLAMSPTVTAYTPMLGRLVETFGEEHVKVCERCFEAVVDRDQITTDSVNEALAILYAACGVVTANVRMKADEVKAVNKLKGCIEDFLPVVEFMTELEEKGSKNAGAGETENLNDVGVDVD